VKTAAKAAGVKTYPVVEVFGPTVQGEGALAGVCSHFIRLGGCDWRCSWCDSMHAVEPELVREAPRLTIDETIAHLDVGLARWVTLSGGNPALHKCEALVDALHEEGFLVAVETQGSYWRDWLAAVEHLTISPKPPSSGMVSDRHDAQRRAFFELCAEAQVHGSLKIVAFDDADLAWALEVAGEVPWLPFFISTGTNAQGGEPLYATADRYREVCELVTASRHPSAKRAHVLPQLHVIAWGHRLGV
jgi:7-carboxy-7-deazaguanine synthase